MAKFPTKDYFNQHPLEEDSAEELAYKMVLVREIYDDIDGLNEMMKEEGMGLPDTSKKKAEVMAISEPSELIRLLRQPQELDVQVLIIHRLLEREEEIMPEIQRIILRTHIDCMIESALMIFVRCKANYSDWIVENMKNIRSPYAQALMCMVLGFRSDPSVIPFLTHQVDMLEDQWPDRTFYNGPVLALFELCERFQNK